MKRIKLTWQDVEKQVQELLRQLHQDQWKPDYIVGLTRGGLMPANLLSQYLGVRMETLKVKLRDCEPNEACESNLWMAEDAIGYIYEEDRKANGGWMYLPARAKKILIVDDINDSGATLNWIKEDWSSSLGGCNKEDVDAIWGNSVRVAVLYDNESSECTVPITYSAVDINKAVEDQWIVFPWEEWWK